MVRTSPSRSCRLLFSLPLKRRRKFNRQILIGSSGLRTQRVAGEVGLHGIGAPLEAARYLNQVLDVHIGGQGIAAGLGHFALHVHRWRVYLRGIAVDQDAVARFKQIMLSAEFPASAPPRFTLKIFSVPSGWVRNSWAKSSPASVETPPAR